jgi:hypothetical protein
MTLVICIALWYERCAFVRKDVGLAQDQLVVHVACL